MIFFWNEDKLLWLILISSTNISPLFGSIRPDKIFKKVDLPTPDFPDIPIILPFLIFKFSTYNSNFSLPGYENFIFLSSMDLLNLTNSLFSFFENLFLYKNEFLKSS